MCRSEFLCIVFFFFKQKTAYEMRISDWSSDVCSSDLPARRDRHPDRAHGEQHDRREHQRPHAEPRQRPRQRRGRTRHRGDREPLPLTLEIPPPPELRRRKRDKGSRKIEKGLRAQQQADAWRAQIRPRQQRERHKDNEEGKKGSSTEAK